VDWVKRMNALQKHRGPDDEGVYADDTCVLGHRRLSIIDLSEKGHQPFLSDDGRYQLVYNGEIYNYIELREELQKIGWKFRSKTDTEVLLKAYLEYGEDCLNRFNGMFAFVIYDSVQKRLFLARDRVGIKPLYYTLKDSALSFASEVKALSGIPVMKPSMNPQALFDYLVFNRTDIYDETFINEIKRLPKGCYATFDHEGLKIRQWWNPEDYVQDSSHNDLTEALRKIQEILISAVQIRMRSDVPVGSCLSGGLDSSILIGILFTHYSVREGYPTFTAAFPGHRLDETRYIDELNKTFHFKNYRTFPTVHTVYEQLNDFVYTNDEPTTNYSFYTQYEVMKLAKEKGITVLLDGQGGDENFAGYHYFHGFYFYGLLKRREMTRLGLELTRSILRSQDKSAYQTLVFQLLPDALRKKLLLKSVPYIEPEFFYEYVDSSRIYNEFFNVEGLNHSLVRHFQYKLEHLLRMEDRNSMAFSVEARVPYLDYRLIEYVLGMPESLKIRGAETKYLQKAALGQFTIPAILDRKDKIGFGTPGKEWMLMEPWKKMTAQSYDHLEHTWSRVFKKGCSLPQTGFDRWKINQLSAWGRLFLS
jgi:asparagine synthase (glutamine-hydrolysing)